MTLRRELAELRTNADGYAWQVAPSSERDALAIDGPHRCTINPVAVVGLIEMLDEARHTLMLITLLEPGDTVSREVIEAAAACGRRGR